jgi:hypothetical protein
VPSAKFAVVLDVNGALSSVQVPHRSDVKPTSVGLIVTIICAVLMLFAMTASSESLKLFSRSQ